MSADYRSLINRDLPPLEKGCWSKARFASRREANTARRQGRVTKTADLKPYRCRYYGDHWHLGHSR